MLKQTKMIKALAVAMILSSITTIAQAQSVTIRGVRLAGSGCSDATGSATTTPNGKTLSLLFDNYKADIGNGSSNPNSTSITKNCRVMIDVDVPYGYQFAIAQTDYRGFAALPQSAYGLHRFTQIVPNQSIPSMREAQVKGPIADDYVVSVKQKPGRYVFSPCNKPVQTIELMSELMVSYFPGTNDRTLAQINLDSIDTGVNSSFELVWQTCR